MLTKKIPQYGIAHGYIVTANENGTIPLNSRIVTKLDEDNGASVKTMLHCANAYKPLVEALKDLTGKIEVMGGCNAYDFEGETAWPEFERVTELLKKLGED